MKLLLRFLLISSLFSCTKDSENFEQAKTEIAGTWEFEKYVGYPFAGPMLPPGNGKIIVIHKDGKFERKQHDTLLFSGMYELERKKDCYQRSTEILFSSNDPLYNFKQYIEIKDEKLILGIPNCYQDAGFTYYRRIR